MSSECAEEAAGWKFKEEGVVELDVWSGVVTTVPDGFHEAPESRETEREMECCGLNIVEAESRTPDRNLIARGYVCFPGGGYIETGPPTSVGTATLFAVELR